MKRVLLFIITTFILNSALQAANKDFTVTAPKVVEVGEQFRLTYKTSKRGESLKIPTITNFQILMGPSTSSSSNTQIINGKVTRNSNFSYTYILSAKKKGRFTIPPATIVIDGNKVASNAIIIEVVDGQKKQTQNNNSQQQVKSTKISKENLFVRVNLSKRSAYMGEHIVATIKVYTRLNLAGFGEIKFPSFDGFLSQEIPAQGQIKLERENINGVIYQAGVIRKLILFPQHTGKIKIEPFELECIIRQRKKQRSRGFFNDFFESYQDTKVPCKSYATSINIKELPKNKPAGFNGAVGNFQLSSSVDRNTLKANEAINLTVKITGNGNLKLINPPSFDFPADFEVYEPETNQKINTSSKGSSGTLTFKYLLIPRHGGDYTIPSVPFSYFDPAINRYKTKHTKKFTFSVEKGEGGDSSGVVASFSKEDVRVLSKDIRFIKTNKSKLKQKGSFFFASLYFYLAFLIPFIIFVLAFILNRKRIKENSDIVKVKNKRANKLAMKKLKLAAKRLENKEKELFYEEILKAIWGYTSDKLNLPLSALNKENISEILREKKIDNEIIIEFISIIDTCEFARYAPASGSEAMDELYKTTTHTITHLEDNIK